MAEPLHYTILVQSGPGFPGAISSPPSGLHESYAMGCPEIFLCDVFERAANLELEKAPYLKNEVNSSCP